MDRSDALKLEFLTTVLLLAGCSKFDPNAEPTYGEKGHPKNCRAIIAMNIQSWRAQVYTADEVLAAIDRNCGANGHSWGQ